MLSFIIVFLFYMHSFMQNVSYLYGRGRWSPDFLETGKP